LLGEVWAERPRVVFAQLAGRAVPVSKDDGLPRLCRHGIPHDGERQPPGRHAVRATGAGPRDCAHVFPVLYGHQREPLRLHGRGLGYYV
nr:hypothetical protein [Tanacetum cinerariifolium]